MIAGLRRLYGRLSARPPLLCALGRHDVIRCAGRDDHAWTHNGRRWHADLRTPPPHLTPAEALAAELAAVAAMVRTPAEVAARAELDLHRAELDPLWRPGVAVPLDATPAARPAARRWSHR